MTSTALLTKPVHCQICGRAIKAKRGQLALHGYRRPHLGWQTASCPGARQLPYEVDRSAIKRTVAGLQDWIAGAERTTAEWIAKPPAALSYQHRVGGPSYRPLYETRSEPRPEGFDPAAVFPRVGREDELRYARLFASRQAERAEAVRGAQATVKELQARFDAWAPDAELQAMWAASGYRLEGLHQID